jgi:glutaminyl-peptide cyclotransferase
MTQATSNMMTTMERHRKSLAERQKKIARWTRYLNYTGWIVAAGLTALTAFIVVYLLSPKGAAAPPGSKLELKDIPFDGKQAYAYLKKICGLGPRPSGSPGMLAQRKLLVEHFKKLGAKVELQRFKVSHPQNGSPVEMVNLLVCFHPESKRRILLCTHFDTLPFPMRDPEDPRGVFIGANDGASGVAVLMELGNEISKSKVKYPYGIDFLFLDGEEFRFADADPMFLGSWYFAQDYVKKPPLYRYRWCVLLDMIGDKDLQIYQERNTMVWADSRPLVAQIWNTAARLGVKEFIARPKCDVEDDHLLLHNVGRIPSADVIDFDYPVWPDNRFWHTRDDSLDKCSPLSLAKVGWVIAEWLKTAK